MSVPLSQMWAVASHVLKNRLTGNRQYALVLMLEPLFRCNLACAGCGKVQYPPHILKRQLTPEQCFAAAEECDAPIISIPGGEPLLHPQIADIADGLTARGRFVYLCTNATMLEEKMNLFKPTKRLTFSVHLDGPQKEHDFAVCREGTHATATAAMRAAIARGFRVTTNTTLFDGADPVRFRAFFDELMSMGVEGMTVAPGYCYRKAPDQERFLQQQKTRELFRTLFENRKKNWQFNQSPLYLEFLQGHADMECAPWGTVAYNIFGWQRPCYVLEEGYAKSFKELLAVTAWQNYGRRSGNDKCRDCMLHSGFEPAAVDCTFLTWKGFRLTVKAALSGKTVGSSETPAVFPANRPKPAVPETEENKPAPVEERLQPRQNMRPDVSTPKALRAATDAAFDYRGDVTVCLKSGETLDGYVFNRVASDDGGILEMLPKEELEARVIAFAEIASLAFTGKDMADGRSWENWVQKNAAKQAALAEGRAFSEDLEPKSLLDEEGRKEP
jgi:hopanoid biosynthesis associated radical SAM protein HpnH